jgi:hypothetical protein
MNILDNGREVWAGNPVGNMRPEALRTVRAVVERKYMEANI